jgi:hypothetical protein
LRPGAARSPLGGSPRVRPCRPRFQHARSRQAEATPPVRVSWPCRHPHRGPLGIQRPSALASCGLVIDDRPLTPRLRASACSWAYVGPWAPPCDRSPPRRDEEMSRVDVRLAVFDSPDRARSLFTVRAAISSARPVFSPRRFALAVTCSYCRSRLGLDPRGTSATSQLPLWHASRPVLLPRQPAFMPGSTVMTSQERVVALVTTDQPAGGPPATPKGNPGTCRPLVEYEWSARR